MVGSTQSAAGVPLTPAGQVVPMTPEAMTATIRTLELTIAQLDYALVRLARGEKLDELPPVPSVDRGIMWACTGCGQRLGTYSADDDVLRIKYKDLFIWNHPGAGGWLEMVCWRCGTMNTVRDGR
jgi:hypothetical protein